MNKPTLPQATHSLAASHANSTAAAVARSFPFLLSLPVFRCWEDVPLGPDAQKVIDGCDQQ
jgi:hypothetical protein